MRITIQQAVEQLAAERPDIALNQAIGELEVTGLDFRPYPWGLVTDAAGQKHLIVTGISFLRKKLGIAPDTVISHLFILDPIENESDLAVVEVDDEGVMHPQESRDVTI